MKITLFAYWQQYEWQPESELTFYPCAMPKEGGKHSPVRTPAGEFDLDLPIEPVKRADMVNGMVEKIKAEQTALRNEIFKLDGKIAELLAIEDKSGESA